MSVQALVIAFTILVSVLVSAGLLSRITRLPAPSMQLLVGALVTNLVIALGFDTGLRYQSFHDLVFYLFLPLLVFAAAYEINLDSLRRTLAAALTLAFGGILITCGLVSVMVFWGIDHPSGFPWIAALLTGALLAATDPAAVTGQPAIKLLKHDTAVLLEGESLFNDASAVVLFSVLLSVATTQGASEQPVLHALTYFAKELFGGALVGAVAGGIGLALIARSTHSSYRLWVGLAAAFAAYHGALAVHASGVIASLVCGLAFALWRVRQQTASNDLEQWQFLSTTANGMLFALMGATLTWSMFEQRWLAMGIGIVAALVARLCTVHFTLGAFNVAGWYHSTGAERTLVSMLGMRGAITIALVLIFPTDLPYWWTVQSIAYGVVLFDLMILAPSAGWFIRRLA